MTMRVLVVRARRQAEVTARRLRDAGHEPVVAPILEIVPREGPPPAGLPDALVVTSRNAVPALARHVGALAAAPTFAVGTRTAAALVGAGFVRAEAAGPDALALARTVVARCPAGATILHAAGLDRKPEPETLLQASGMRLVTWVVYEARAVARLPDEVVCLLRDGPPTAVLHYSARSAALLVRLVAEAGLSDAFGRLSHACISVDVAAALGRVAGGVAVAAAPEEAHLFGALDDLAKAPSGRLGSPTPQSRC